MADIPVFHNLCGKRTTVRTCDCKICREVRREWAKVLNHD